MFHCCEWKYLALYIHAHKVNLWFLEYNVSSFVHLDQLEVGVEEKGEWEEGEDGKEVWRGWRVKDRWGVERGDIPEVLRDVVACAGYEQHHLTSPHLTSPHLTPPLTNHSTTLHIRHTTTPMSIATRSTTKHHAAPRSTTQHHAAPRSTTQHHAAPRNITHYLKKFFQLRSVFISF